MQPHLTHLYTHQPRKFAFTARTLKDYFIWQSAFRTELTHLLGIDQHSRAPGSVEMVAATEREKCFQQKYIIDTGEGVGAALYVLVPKRNPPYRPILVFHGHDPSAKYCLGNYPNDETARANIAIHNNYALALAEAGYLVGVVEQRGMGERVTDLQKDGRSCRHLSFSYQMHGRTLLGERIWDGMCAATYLLSRPDVSGDLGCTGHSGGGTTALWLAALDERVRDVLVSGYFSSFHASVLSIEHCECNYVPGMLALGEMGDLACLIAPRRFCALNGQQDPIFPVQSAITQFETVRQAYALHHAEDACQLIVHAGGHVYDNELSKKFLENRE